MRILFFIFAVSGVLFFTALYVVTRALAAANRLEGRDGKPRRALRMGITIALFGFMLLPWLSRFHETMHVVMSERLSALGFLVSLGVLFSAAFLVLVDGLGALLRRARRQTNPGIVAPELIPDAELAPASEGAAASEGPTAREASAPAASEAPASAPSPAPQLPIPRRTFLERAAYGTAIAVGAGHSGYAMFVGRHDYALEEITVRIRDLPAALEGISIAQISDIHIGTFVREPELDAGLSLLRRANADLIVMTGDLMDHDARLVPLLGRLARGAVELRPRFGVHGIAGNHDYYTDVDAVLGTLRDAGVNVLRNQATELRDGSARLALLGTDDVWAERDNWGTRYDFETTLAAAAPDCPRILLCHNPERFRDVAPHVDLQLSGHTHGGQVNLVVRPADAFLRHGFVAGHYSVGEGQLYVNRGFGTVGPPARLYAPPEITKITLVRA